MVNISDSFKRFAGAPPLGYGNTFESQQAAQINNIDTSKSILSRVAPHAAVKANASISTASIDTKSKNYSQGDVSQKQSMTQGAAQSARAAKGIIAGAFKEMQNELRAATKEAGYNYDEIFPDTRDGNHTGASLVFMAATDAASSLSPVIKAASNAMKAQDIIESAKSGKVNRKQAIAEILEVTQKNASSTINVKDPLSGEAQPTYAAPIKSRMNYAQATPKDLELIAGATTPESLAMISPEYAEADQLEQAALRKDNDLKMADTQLSQDMALCENTLSALGGGIKLSADTCPTPADYMAAIKGAEEKAAPQIQSPAYAQYGIA